MRNTVCIFVFHFCGVRPAFRPIGAHRHESAGGDLAMIFLPLFHAVEGKGVIRIFYRFFMHIDNDQRQYHFFRVDLINGAQPFDKMRRWINMCAPLSNMREEFREESGAHCARTFVVPVNCFPRFIRKTGPSWNSRCKPVC
jgi:hypothetical protein